MEEEINYASVVFRNRNVSPPPVKKEEETVYDEVKVKEKTTDQTPDTNGLTKQDEAPVLATLMATTPDGKRAKRYQVLGAVVLCLGVLCILLSSAVIALYIHMTTAISTQRDRGIQLVSELRDNQTKLLTANQNLSSIVNNLRQAAEMLQQENKNVTNLLGNLYIHMTTTTEMLKQENKNITNLLGNLSRAYDVLQNDNSNLTTQINELKTDKTTLDKQIETMNTTKKELKEAILQFENFPVTAYCPQGANSQERSCRPCQEGWRESQSNCYVYINPDLSGRKTWEEAKEDCRGRNASLVDIQNSEEQTYIYNLIGWAPEDFWIGLKRTNNEWRWTDGSNLTVQYWMDGQSGSGDCAVYIRGQEPYGWRTGTCTEKKQWICKMKAVLL